jgi:outer membrane protein assembly factor BamA
MKRRGVIARLLILAAFCAAGASRAAAQQQPARAPAGDGRARAVGPPVRWNDVRIEFVGNRVFTGEQLLGLTGRCYERYRKDDPVFNSDVLDYCLRRDVTDFMQQSGYVRAGVGAMRVEESWPGVKITVPVEEDKLYRLGDIRIEGAEFFTAGQIRELLPLETGQVADGGAVVEWLSERLKKKYEDDGFIQYEYDVEPQFRPASGAGNEGVVDLLITITEGRRFVLRKVAFKGKAGTPEDLLRGALLVKEGEAFSMQQFRDGIEALNKLDLFERIDADRDSEFRTDDETGDLKITIRLKEKTQAAGGSPASPSNR